MLFNLILVSLQVEVLSAAICCMYAQLLKLDSSKFCSRNIESCSGWLYLLYMRCDTMHKGIWVPVGIYHFLDLVLELLSLMNVWLNQFLLRNWIMQFETCPSSTNKRTAYRAHWKYLFFGLPGRKE